MSEYSKHYAQYLEKNKDRINRLIKSEQKEIAKKVRDEVALTDESLIIGFFLLFASVNLILFNVVIGVAFSVLSLGVIVLFFYTSSEKRARLCYQLENKYVSELIDKIIERDELKEIDAYIERVKLEHWNKSIHLIRLHDKVDELDVEAIQELFSHNLTSEYNDIKQHYSYYAEKLKKEYFVYREIKGYTED